MAPDHVEQGDSDVQTVYRPRVADSAGSSLTVFTIAGIVIGILLGSLILVGGLWNIGLTLRRKREDSDSDSDNDSMDLDLSNTDLESRMGTSSRPPSRARSYRYLDCLGSLSYENIVTEAEGGVPCQ